MAQLIIMLISPYCWTNLSIIVKVDSFYEGNAKNPTLLMYWVYITIVTDIGSFL